MRPSGAGPADPGRWCAVLPGGGADAVARQAVGRALHGDRVRSPGPWGERRHAAVVGRARGGRHCRADRRRGRSARLLGISSGAVLALEAASRGLPITKLAVYEPPFIVDASRPPVADDFIPGLHRLLAAGKRDEVVRRFMRMVGMPGVLILLTRLFPTWRKLTAVAHTVPYDLTIMRGTQAGKPLPRDRWSALRAPNLVLDGGKSPAWMRHGCRALADLLPQSSYRTLPGQTHMVKPAVLAPALIDFLAPA
jgi:hypothetical protein